MDFPQLAAERYSMRKFTTQPVAGDDLQAILNIARLAPSAVNRQPWRLLVMQSAQSMEKLKECTPYTFDAPMAIAVCAVPEEAWVRPFDQDNSALVDAAILGTHIMLAAHNLGLGCTWVGFFNVDVFRKLFNVPASVIPVAIFPIGHPAPDAKPSGMHARRKALAEIFVSEQFGTDCA